jgi:hypothetical protein
LLSKKIFLPGFRVALRSLVEKAILFGLKIGPFSVELLQFEVNHLDLQLSNFIVFI